MKSEERHEIETNELAKILTGGSDKIAPYVSYVVYGVLIVAAVWAIARLTTGNMRSKQLQEWDSYTIATLPGRFDANALKGAAKVYEGKPVGELAQIAWADSQLAAGCQNFFTDKKQAMEELDTALTEYEGLTKSAGDKNLRARAQLGVAKTLEAKGEVTKAIEAYQKVTGPFSEMADARAKSLEELNAVEYADWLAEAEGARRPSNFGTGRTPDFSADALDLPGGDAASAAPDGTGDFLDLLDQYQRTAPDAPAEGVEADTATESGADDETSMDEATESGEASAESTEQPADEAAEASDEATDENPAE